MDRSRSPEERAALVVAQMTLDEKVQETGSMLDATHSRETPPIPRLCVPALRLNNGSAGVSTGGPVQLPATALPAPIGLAATWDPALAWRYENFRTLLTDHNLIDRRHAQLAVFREAETEYEVRTGERVAHWQRR